MRLLRAITVLGSIGLAAVVALFVLQAVPGLVGADVTYVIQSGSMEPAISTGSVVFVETVPSEEVPERIREGDVITFADSEGVPTTTHRVVRKYETDASVRFVTKGDANENVDPEPVYRDEVVGKVTMSIPLIGYVVAFSQTIWGWFLLVVLPVSVLLVDGFWQLYLSIEPEGKAE